MVRGEGRRSGHWLEPRRAALREAWGSRHGASRSASSSLDRHALPRCLPRMKAIYISPCCLVLVAAGGCNVEIAQNHRTGDALCATSAPAGNISCGAECPAGPTFQCGADADCTDGSNGRCVNGGGPAGSYCVYDGCASDGDCGISEVCGCHGTTYASPWSNSCVPGNCRLDADCGPHGFCSPASSLGECSGSLAGYYCHTSADACINDSDCGPQKICTYGLASHRWECQGPVVVCL